MTKKICCKALKEVLEHIDDYPSLLYQVNIDNDDNISFDLAFTHKSKYGQNWCYLKYCPFCGKGLDKS